MREKCRAWDTRSNNWVEGLELVIQTSGQILVIPDDVILTWSIGLKDRLGKEIYEGDIVRYYAISYQVKLDDFINLQYLKERQIELEVIGNIYEHPELLEQS